jgi:hypothetical protein
MTFTTLSCETIASISISSSNRSTLANPGFRTFIARGTLSIFWRTRHTAPMPPSPMRCSTM